MDPSTHPTLSALRHTPCHTRPSQRWVFRALGQVFVFLVSLHYPCVFLASQTPFATALASRLFLLCGRSLSPWLPASPPPPTPTPSLICVIPCCVALGPLSAAVAPPPPPPGTHSTPAEFPIPHNPAAHPLYTQPLYMANAFRFNAPGVVKAAAWRGSQPGATSVIAVDSTSNVTVVDTGVILAALPATCDVALVLVCSWDGTFLRASVFVCRCFLYA